MMILHPGVLLSIWLAGPAAAQARPADPCAAAAGAKTTPARAFTVREPKGWKVVSRGGPVAAAEDAGKGAITVRGGQEPVSPERCVATTASLARAGKAFRQDKDGQAPAGKGELWYAVGVSSQERSPCGKAGTPELMGLFRGGKSWYAVDVRLCAGDPLAVARQVLETYKPR